MIFGKGVTSAAPGSAQGLYLVVSDIEAARADLAARGVEVEVFHDAGGVFHQAGRTGRLSGPDPERRSYSSFASFSDPDGNVWLLQEVTARLPGRVEGDTTFGLVPRSRRRACGARRPPMASTRSGMAAQHDANWPDWYAEHIVREQAGQELLLVGGAAARAERFRS